MAKPIIEMCGLELHEFMPAHIEPFFRDISFETEQELRVAYKLDPLVTIISCLNEDMVYSVMRDGKPLAITGLRDNGTMWLLFSNGLRKNFVRFARASPALVEYYKKFTPELQCEIWDRSQMIAKWLVLIGFEEVETLNFGTEHNFLRFVHCKDNNKYGQSSSPRPVMH